MTKSGADNRTALAMPVNGRCASPLPRTIDETKPLRPIPQELRSSAISDAAHIEVRLLEKPLATRHKVRDNLDVGRP